MTTQPESAAALSAFRAACVALVKVQEGHEEDTESRQCYSCGYHQCAATCPVALARAALEKFPEVTE